MWGVNPVIFWPGYSFIDGHLDKWYSNFGFKLKERIDWDDQYAPKGWNYEKYGRPTVSF
jgi:hypothetical protein